MGQNSTKPQTAETKFKPVVSYTKGPWSPEFIRTNSIITRPPTATRFSSVVLSDKIHGIIFGVALGDAVGVNTEFLNKKQIYQYFSRHHSELNVNSKPSQPTSNDDESVNYAEKIKQLINSPTFKLNFGLEYGILGPGDTHRSKFEKNCWTDDTDQMLLVLDTILDTYTKKPSTTTTSASVSASASVGAVGLEASGVGSDGTVIDYKQFATRLLYWANFGYDEMTPVKAARGIGYTVGSVLSHPSFAPELSCQLDKFGNVQAVDNRKLGVVGEAKSVEQDPHKAAYEVAEKYKFNLAANGAIMRTAVVSVPYFWEVARVVENCVGVAKTTHWDDRCVSSCRVYNVLIARLLQGDILMEKSADGELAGNVVARVREVVGDEVELCLRDVRDPMELKKYVEWGFEADSLAVFELDGASGIGYTYRAFGASLWCLVNGIKRLVSLQETMNPDVQNCSIEDISADIKAKVFKEMIMTLIFEGGDADTNAAVAGGLLGVVAGYEGLPVEWRDGLNRKEWLAERCGCLVSLVG